ncbi:MAG: hypothetical protein AB1638_00395 [Nitrospirota bacterium]
MNELTEKALSILNRLLAESDNLEIMLVENDLIVNGNPLWDPGLQGNNFVKRLKKKGISRIDFTRGVNFSEIKQFIADISEADSEPTSLMP